MTAGCALTEEGCADRHHNRDATLGHISQWTVGNLHLPPPLAFRYAHDCHGIGHKAGRKNVLKFLLSSRTPMVKQEYICCERYSGQPQSGPENGKGSRLLQLQESSRKGEHYRNFARRVEHCTPSAHDDVFRPPRPCTRRKQEGPVKGTRPPGWAPGWDTWKIGNVGTRGTPAT